MARLLQIVAYRIEAQSTEEWYSILRELDKHRIPYQQGPTASVPRYYIDIPAHFLEKTSAALVLVDIHLEHVEPTGEA